MLAFLFKVKSVSLVLIMVIYGKKPSKIENKTQPSLAYMPAYMAATEPADFHQPQVQNIYGCFLQPDILKT
jgi:hypothetical protein